MPSKGVLGPAKNKKLPKPGVFCESHAYARFAVLRFFFAAFFFPPFFAAFFFFAMVYVEFTRLVIDPLARKN